MADGIRYSFATEEEADLNASKWDVKTVLAVMSRSTAWVHGELARTVARRYGGPEPASRKANIMEDPQVSPRVEVVQDDEMEDQDYGIQEVSSNAASPEEEPVDPRSRWPIQEESTAGQETQSIQRQKVFSGGNLNRPVELPTPEGSPNFGKRKLPPSPKIQHIDRTAPLPSPPDQPILFPDVSHKVRTSEHKPGFAPQHQNPDLRNDGKSSPQSTPASASTRSTISNEPLPTTPEDSDRRRPSDTSDTLLGEIFADAPSPISFYSDGSSIMTDTDSDASSLAPLSVGNKKRLITATAEIPWIPSSEHQLGPLATHMIMSAWYDARAKLRECRCSICLRAKKRTLEEALGWADAWVGEGGKKARLG